MPRRRDPNARVHRPTFIKRSKYWKVTTVDQGGTTAAERSSSRYFGTKEEAEEWRTGQLEDLARAEKQTVAEILNAHEEHVRASGIAEYSVGEKMRRLRLFFDQVKDRQITRLSPEDAAKLYAAFRMDQNGKSRAVEYHRNVLGNVKGFIAWCIEENLLEKDPFAKVKGVGTRKKGKEQLTGDEARKFHATALVMADEGDEGALGADMLLIMGLRQGEVRLRQVRDLDLEGTVLRVLKWTKTKKSERIVGVPDFLQGRLRELAEERNALEMLFPQRDGSPHTRAWLLAAVNRVCARAGVPRVTPHGLRGTFSTIGAELVGVQAVADALGHEDVQTTMKHYAKAGAVEAGQQGRALAVIQGGRR